MGHQFSPLMITLLRLGWLDQLPETGETGSECPLLPLHHLYNCSPHIGPSQVSTDPSRGRISICASSMCDIQCFPRWRDYGASCFRYRPFTRRVNYETHEKCFTFCGLIITIPLVLFFYSFLLDQLISWSCSCQIINKHT